MKNKEKKTVRAGTLVDSSGFSVAGHMVAGMKKIIRHAFFRYLISYAVILLFPIIVLGITVHWVFTGPYIDDILEKNLQIPRQIQTSVDMQVTQMDSFAHQVSTNPSFLYEYLQNTAVPYDTFQSLYGFNTTNAFVGDLMYYPGGDQNLYYGVEGVYDPEILLQTIYCYEELDAGDFAVFSQAYAKPAWLPGIKKNLYSGRESAYITYIRPVYSNSWKTQPFLLFLVDYGSFEKIIGSFSGGADVTNVIASAGGEVLYSSHSPMSMQEVQQMLDDYGEAKSSGVEGWKILQTASDSVYISRINSETGLSYLTLIPQTVMLQRLSQIQNTFILIYFVLVTCGFLLVFFVSRYHYLPVQKLQAAIQISSCASAEAVIRQAESTIRTLSQSSRDHRREHLLLSLLQENSIKRGDNRLREAGISFDGPYIQTAVLTVHPLKDRPGHPQQEHLQKTVQEAFSGENPCYAIKYMEKNCFILIFTQPSGGQSDCTRRLEAGIGRLKRGRIAAQLFAGNAYSSLQMLHQSFYEAKLTFFSRHACTTGSIHYYGASAESAKLPAQTYPKEDLTALCNAIQHGDILLVEFLSKKIVLFIEQDIQDPFLSRCVCYDAINQIMKACEENQTGWIQDICADITQNLALSSSDDLILVFKTLCSRVIIDLEETVVQPRRLGMKDAVAYIDDHFCDMDFSAKALAADYGLTISNFSHQFKKYTGKTVSDYVHEKKFHCAKQLLRETDLSIADIAGKAGYLHTSSFIRKYKQMEGITPGEYQAQFRQIKKG